MSNMRNAATAVALLLAGGATAGTITGHKLLLGPPPQYNRGLLINNPGYIVANQGYSSNYMLVFQGTNQPIVLPNGGRIINLGGLTDQGELVGTALAPKGRYKGFIWRNGQPGKYYEPPGYHGTGFDGVNNAGVIVGSRTSSSTGVEQGFLFQNGVYTPIAVPGAYQTYPVAINASGEVVGNYYGTDLATHGFLYANGTFTTIDLPPVGFTLLTAISDGGQILGTGASANNTESTSYVVVNGVATPLDVPGSIYTSTSARGQSQNGTVTGVYSDATDTETGFIYNGGTYSSFPIPANYYEYPLAVNNIGTTTGFVQPVNDDLINIAFEATCTGTGC